LYKKGGTARIDGGSDTPEQWRRCRREGWAVGGGRQQLVVVAQSVAATTTSGQPLNNVWMRGSSGGSMAARTRPSSDAADLALIYLLVAHGA
jgi:hypothetical protein